MTIVDFLERAADVYPGRRAVIVVGGSQLTYAELRSRIRRFVSGLSELGIRRGDRVGILASNGLTFFDVYLGAAYLGAAAVPISTRLAPPEVRYQVSDAEPALIVADPVYAPHLSSCPVPRLGIVITSQPEYARLLGTAIT